MRVLFVFSGNSDVFPVAPFIEAQAESLRSRGVQIDYFPVVGKGWRYLKNVAPLRRKIREARPDLVHAHYSLCGWVAVLAAGRIPVILSVMGDDAYGTFTSKNKTRVGSRLLILLTRLIQPFVAAIIFKAANLRQAVWRRKVAHLVPNGVRLDQFELVEGGCRGELGLDPERRYVLFLGNPSDPNKNIALVRRALTLVDRDDVELLSTFPVPHDTVVRYLNSVDVLALCSFGEGSPNVVKEAMACNCPVVATPAGDVEWLLDKLDGCYIGGYEAEDFAEKLCQALEFAARHDRTNGRQRLAELGLDAGSVADRILGIYREVAS